MRTKILATIMLMFFAVVLVAQPDQKNADRHPYKMVSDMQLGEKQNGLRGLNLTDAQKEAFKQNMLATHKLVQPLRNELGEAEAHQRTLMTAEKPNLAAINKNIEKIGAIRVEMAKIQAKAHLDMRAQLTDEQKIKFDLFREKQKMGKGHKGMKGPKGPKGLK